MRYRLRTLLILLAVGPPLVAVGWWQYTEWREAQARRAAFARELLEFMEWSNSHRFDNPRPPFPAWDETPAEPAPAPGCAEASTT